jgi:FAD/FMN-containing dehydrogenase
MPSQDRRRAWSFRINVGTFCADPGAVDWARIETGLRFRAHGDPARTSFADYLHREDARNAALTAAWRETPARRLYIAMFLPGSAAVDFIGRILANPEDTAGMNRFSLYALPTHRFTRPMFVLPETDVALNVFLFRSVPRADDGRYAEAVAAVRSLAGRVLAAGGSLYPPYAPFVTRPEWESQYGARRFATFAAAKQRYDPDAILTPGTAMFGA